MVNVLSTIEKLSIMRDGLRVNNVAAFERLSSHTQKSLPVAHSILDCKMVCIYYLSGHINMGTLKSTFSTPFAHISMFY